MYYNEALHYQGLEPYLFVAACEEDWEVLPILEKLAADHRVWFDREIPSPKEDTETIAQKILQSAGCIAFITPKAVEQHSFRREIAYALEKNKPFLAIELKPTALTPGLEMELSDVKRLSYAEYQDQEPLFFFHIRRMDFVQAAEILYPPFKQPADGRPVQPIPSAEINEPDTIPPEKLYEPVAVFPDSPDFLDRGPTALVQEGNVPFSTFPPLYLTPVNNGQLEMDDTLLQPLFQENTPVGAWLVRSRTGEKIPLGEKPFCLGRSLDDCDYVISGNSAISKKHTMIFPQDGRFYAMDLGSFNHTYINNSALMAQQPCGLQNGDIIRLANEGFTFCQTEEGRV